ncbi:MAG: nucleotidyltransferase family protein [Desulfovibrio sp.]|jgi:GT2 family glycosyltransferase|nr:nucleotidyltransferase family protein [Desulfovibrio sp.]
MAHAAENTTRQENGAVSAEAGGAEFSLLVVTTDRLHFVERLFQSLAEQTYKDFEVILVHGEACAGEVPSFVRKHACLPAIKTVLSPGLGLSRARNLALPMLRGDFVAFPDDDCVYRPGTLAKVLSLFRAHPEADVLLAGAAVLPAEADPQADGKGMSVRKERPFSCGKKNLRAVGRYSAFRRSETFVQFYRRSCVDAVGPFDEGLGPGTGLPYGCGEDTDYVLRALASGFGVFRASDAVVCHPAVNLHDPALPRKVKAYAAGRMYLLHKHAVPFWFVMANIAWPLMCIPGECLRECLAVARCRLGMFRARVESCGPAAEHVPGTPGLISGGSRLMPQSPSSMDRIIRKLRDQYVTELDQALLDCVFAQAPTQETLDSCLSVCDIEVMGAHKSLMLSYLMHDHPELKFSEYAAPRLKGLISFFRFADMEILAHYSKIGKALNAADIPHLIFKGAAMKALRPELSRPMGDVDILVHPEHLAAAVRVCEKLGYHDALTGSAHAVDMHTADGKSAVDIHSAVIESAADTGLFHRNLFSRARARRAFGVDTLLPAHEDLFFIVLANLMKNLREKTSIHGLFYALFDCRFLLADKAGFDWNIVHDNARSTGIGLELRLAAEFMNTLVPGIVPDRERHFPLTRKMEDFCNRIIFDEEFFRHRQNACRAIRVVDLKNYPVHYGGMILKLLLLKKLRSSPGFVRRYLDTRGKRACDAH